ncbi:MAG: sodium:solute symporter family protein, partial [Deltaproteobacteria bacterium]|nr:sodium:solute symporter family protein [Deltaproteobacteria bacterium]
PFGFFLASRVRRLHVYTLPDILRGAYGERAAVPAGVMIVMAWCGVVAAQLVAGGRLVAGLFPVDFELALVIVSVVFILYTFWGGQLSVIRTDYWQLLLFVGGLLLSLGLLLLSQASTPAFWENIPDAHWRFPVSPAFGWYEVLVFYPLIIGLPYLVGPDIYSRVLCSRDDGVAKKSALMAAMIVIPLSFVLAFFGLVAKAQFTGIPPEAALPKTVALLVPIGLKGLVVAGFLGAIMSSADTCLLSASTIFSLNVIRPFTKARKERNLMITRAAVLVIGAGAWFIASRQKEIISSLLLGYTVFVGGVVIPTLGTFCKKQLKITPNGALWAIIIGGVTAILGKIQGGVLLKALLTSHGRGLLEPLLGPHYLSILPIILSALVLILVSRIRRHS